MYLIMNNKLLDELFVISGIVKVARCKCYQPSQRLRLITLAETLVI